MSNYPNTTLTHAGQDLIAESITEGEALIFTKVVLGDGELQEGQSIAALTALISPKLNVGMTSGSSSGGQVKLRFAVGNSGLDEGFFAREVGIFAKVGENGTETLYAYTNGGNYVDYIPDKTRPIDNQIMDVYIVTGNAPNVEIQVSSDAYITVADMQEHESNANAHSALMGAHNVDALAHVLDVDDTVVPSSNHGALAAIMNNVANMLKQIKGDNNWKTAPGISLAAILGDFATNLSVTTDPDTGVFTCASLGITGLMAQNGYICLGKLFGGLILQWGVVPGSFSGTATLPLAFSSSDYNIVMTCRVGGGDVIAGVNPVTPSTFFYRSSTIISSSVERPATYLAWGI